MPSLIQRSNGIYYGIFTEKGRRKWRSTYTNDKVEASTIFSEMCLEYQVFRKQKLSQFRDCMLVLLKGDLAGTTLALFSGVMNKFITIVGDLEIRKLTPYHIEIYKSKRLQDVSPVKVSIDFRTLKSMLNRAVKLRMIDRNPCLDCKNVRVPPKEPAYLTMEEISKLLRIVEDVRMKAIITLALATGMRAGEIIHLKWENIDFVTRFIHLTNTSDFTLKGRRSRSVPMNQSAIDVLRSLPVESEYVFGREKKLRRPVAGISRKFKWYSRKAGLSEQIHFHSLRHTAASMLVQQGVPLSYIKDLFGHSSISVTQIYLHSSPEHLQSAMAKIDKIFLN
jgi:integrase